MLFLDGAMGTELARRGVDTGLPLWSARALLEQPAIVQQIHEEYIAAGADVITTNTFRTTRRTLQKTGMGGRAEELTRLAVQLARNAIASFPDRNIRIAGSIAPLEDCYHPELVPSNDALAREHAHQCEILASAGVDLLLCETMATIREAHAGGRAAIATGVPTVISFLCRMDGALYSGEPLEEAAREVTALGPAALSINCLSARHMEGALQRLRSASSLPFAIYANAGTPGGEQTGTLECDVTPEDYVGYARRWKSLGAWMIGGCCGTTPAYVALLRRHLAEES